MSEQIELAQLLLTGGLIGFGLGALAVLASLARYAMQFSDWTAMAVISELAAGRQRVCIVGGPLRSWLQCRVDALVRFVSSLGLYAMALLIALADAPLAPPSQRVWTSAPQDVRAGEWIVRSILRVAVDLLLIGIGWALWQLATGQAEIMPG